MLEAERVPAACYFEVKRSTDNISVRHLSLIAVAEHVHTKLAEPILDNYERIMLAGSVARRQTTNGCRRSGLKLAIPPAEIAKIMMDEAVLALMAERLSLSDIQSTFRRYAKRDLPKSYMNLKRLAFDQGGNKSLD